MPWTNYEIKQGEVVAQKARGVSGVSLEGGANITVAVVLHREQSRFQTKTDRSRAGNRRRKSHGWTLLQMENLREIEFA